MGAKAMPKLFVDTLVLPANKPLAALDEGVNETRIPAVGMAAFTKFSVT